MSVSRNSIAAIEAKRSGVYCTPESLDSLRLQAKKTNMVWLDLPLHIVSSKPQFMALCARQLKLPSYFGGNWDALADCLRDLNWLKGSGFVLHLAGHEKFALGAPEDYETALDVLREAADFWKAKGTAFFVLVDGAKALPAY